jgi:hypothetical protein
VNAALQAGIVRLHELVGLNASDPRSTYGTPTFRVNPLSFHEDYAGNPLHLVLGAVALGLFVRHGPRRDPALLAYVACLTGAALLFCLLLKWQPWHSRLHLPLFVLAAPFVAVALTRHLPAPLTLALAGALVLAAMPWVVGNQTRPLLGDPSLLRMSATERMFFNRPELRAPYVGAADALTARGCGQVGLVIGGNDWEYPLWVLLRERLGPSVRVEHVAVQNVSRAAAATDGPIPCGIVAWDQDLAPAIVWRGVPYQQRWTSGALQLFLPEGA